MNTKVIVYYIGVSLLMVAALMLLSGIIACFTPGDESRIPLLFSAFLTDIAGLYPLLFIMRGTERLRFREGNCVVVFSWLTVCLFGMLPYLLSRQEFDALDALFESVSGFTTTGASILDDVEALPRGLQFWRISTAWVGGAGIVTLFSMLITRGGDRSALSGAEISDVARSAFSGRGNALFANRLLVVYLSLTSLTLFALKLTVINVAGGLDFITGLTASVACLGNVGPGFGEVGSMANYAHIPALLKVSGIVEMLLGRLEIFPVLYLFGERYLNK